MRAKGGGRGRAPGQGCELSLADTADLEGGGKPLFQHHCDYIIPAGVGGRIGFDLKGLVSVEETIQVNVDADDGGTGQVE